MIQIAIEQSKREPLYSSINELEVDLLYSDRGLSKNDLMQCAMKSQTIGQCFAIAYRCALQTLLPSLDPSKWTALCVTEKTGNHPKLIETSCTESGRVNGSKSFVSMADRATQLIVIAKLSDTSHTLKALLLDARDMGVKVNVFPELKFIPDIAHGELIVNDAQGIMLPGDGHADYSRVFRFLEDSHVLLAFSSMMLSQALRCELPSAYIQKVLGFVHACVFLNQDDGFIADLILAELFAEFEVLIIDFEGNFHLLPEQFVKNWLRDKKLFSIASKARHARTEKAQAVLLNSVRV